jgi:SAM-dependent methyltransferase
MGDLYLHKCPVCQSKLGAHPAIIPEIDPSFEKKIKKKILEGFTKSIIFFPYYRCKCGMLTTKTFIKEKALNHLYSDMQENVYEDDNRINDIETRKGYLLQIKNFLDFEKKNINLLEIGADNGNFIKLIKQFNNKIDFTAVEPNKKMHKRLKLLTKNVYDNINKIPKDKKFDFIIAVHVFDHIPNLTEFLKKIGKKLRKGGFIYGVVHDERSLMAKLLGKRWPAYSIQHPHLFNPNSADVLFKKLKYKKSFIIKTKNFFNLGFLLQNLFYVIFKIKISFPSFFPIGLKLGNFSFLYKK